MANIALSTYNMAAFASREGFPIGAKSLEIALRGGVVAAVSLVVASPVVLVSAVAWLALSIFGASSTTVALGTALPLVVASPLLAIGGVSVVALTVFGVAGLGIIGVAAVGAVTCWSADFMLPDWVFSS